MYSSPPNQFYFPKREREGKRGRERDVQMEFLVYRKERGEKETKASGDTPNLCPALNVDRKDSVSILPRPQTDIKRDSHRGEEQIIAGPHQKANSLP
jgi:hypothetical protein